MSRLARIRLRVVEWKRVIQEMCGRGYRTVEPLVPPLSVFTLWLFLTLCTSWVVAHWVAQAVVKQEMAAIPRALVAPQQPPPAAAPQRPVGVVPSDAGRRAYLGIRGKEVRQKGIQGVKILEVFPGAPAAAAGLRAAAPTSPHRADGKDGHIIIGANGRLVASEDTLAQLIAQSSPGSVLTLLVTDGETYETIPVVLGEVPEPSSLRLTSAERPPQSFSFAGVERAVPR